MSYVERDKAVKWNIILESSRKQKQKLNIEIWMNIEGYEGMYQVSSLGRVRSLDRVVEVHTEQGIEERAYKGRILAQRDDKDGYKRVTLSNEGKHTTCQVHRLVAKAFIPNPEGKSEVNHKDMDKQNNELFNLEWNTRQENARHYADSTLDRKEALMEAVRANPDAHYRDLMEEFGFGQSLTYRLRNQVLEAMEVS